MAKAKSGGPAKPSPRKWSAAVRQNSDALDLERGVFAKNSPSAIARSLKRSAERSRRRKSQPFRSAMSMLTFYINRAGRKLPSTRLRVLELAKSELRKVFGRGRQGGGSARRMR
jgi:hypothetical protein